MSKILTTRVLPSADSTTRRRDLRHARHCDDCTRADGVRPVDVFHPGFWQSWKSETVFGSQNRVLEACDAPSS